MTNETDTLCEIPTDQLVEPWVLLRPVERHSVEYQELRDSIESEGFLNSLAARACKRRPGMFEIIDGMYRWECAKELGLATVPVIVKEGVTDEDVLSLQIQANAVRPRTRPCDFARQLKRIQDANPEITIAQLSGIVSKSPAWIGQQLGLLRLAPLHQKMVDRGEIPLRSAYMLAKIPPKLRGDHIDNARTMTAREFRVLAASVIKQFKDAVQQGHMDAFFTDGFEPQPYLRFRREALAELQNQAEGPLILTVEDCKTALDGWIAALQWMLHLDRRSAKEQEQVARARSRRHLKTLNL